MKVTISYVVMRDIKYTGTYQMTRQTDPCCDLNFVIGIVSTRNGQHKCHATDGMPMNRIIYIVGVVVIVLFVLGILGLR